MSKRDDFDIAVAVGLVGPVVDDDPPAPERLPHPAVDLRPGRPVPPELAAFLDAVGPEGDPDARLEWLRALLADVREALNTGAWEPEDLDATREALRNSFELTDWLNAARRRATSPAAGPEPEGEIDLSELAF